MSFINFNFNLPQNRLSLRGEKLNFHGNLLFNAIKIPFNTN